MLSHTVHLAALRSALIQKGEILDIWNIAESSLFNLVAQHFWDLYKLLDQDIMQGRYHSCRISGDTFWYRAGDHQRTLDSDQST